jgi:hypothetical protein
VLDQQAVDLKLVFLFYFQARCLKLRRVCYASKGGIEGDEDIQMVKATPPLEKSTPPMIKANYDPSTGCVDIVLEWPQIDCEFKLHVCPSGEETRKHNGRSPYSISTYYS